MNNRFLVLKYVICIIFSIQYVQANSLSYENWSQVVKAFVQFEVTPVTVNYAGLRANRKNLSAFLKQVIKVKKTDYESWTITEKKVFLLNAHNALVLKLILDQSKDNPQFKTLTELNGLFSTYKTKKFYKLFGEDRSLSYLVEELSQPFSSDHFFMWSFSCGDTRCAPPSLYSSDSLEQQIKNNFKLWFKDPEVAKFKIKENKIYLLKMFQDYFSTISQTEFKSKIDFAAQLFTLSQQEIDYLYKNESLLKFEFVELNSKLNGPLF